MGQFHGRPKAQDAEQRGVLLKERSFAAPGSNDGVIQSLKSGFGFITPAAGGPNLFFFHAEVINADFNDLRVGDSVKYAIGRNDRGPCAVDVYIPIR